MHFPAGETKISIRLLQIIVYYCLLIFDAERGTTFSWGSVLRLYKLFLMSRLSQMNHFCSTRPNELLSPKTLKGLIFAQKNVEP